MTYRCEVAVVIALGLLAVPSHAKSQTVERVFDIQIAAHVNVSTLDFNDNMATTLLADGTSAVKDFDPSNCSVGDSPSCISLSKSGGDPPAAGAAP
jgi:hypothetical protein